MTIKYPAVVLKEVDSLVAVGSPQKSNAATFPREFVGIPPRILATFAFIQ